MFRTILVSVDLGEPEMAKPAIDKAVERARASGGALRLVNVQPLLPPSYMDYVPVGFDEAQREEAAVALGVMTAKISLPEERVSCTVRIGGTYPEILAEAEDWGADLIVICSHRPAMSTYLLGSTAKAVVRHAKCSVLVLRE
jgi:nucleotide-binding universal stress UspA family protein